MEEWKAYKLGDLVSLYSGGTPNKANASFWDGDIPWISAKSMYDDFLETSDLCITELGLKNGSKLAKKGTILLTRGSGLFNRIPVCWTCRDLAYNQDVKNIVSKNESLVSTDYLYYWLYGKKDAISSILETTGIGAGKIDTERFLNLEVSLPSLNRQGQILRTIKPLFDKITLNNRINHNLEEQAQALYKSWFVDFEPFKDGKFVDSELGMIPEGWHVGVVNEIIGIQSGFPFKSESFVERGQYLLVTIKAVQDGQLTISGADSLNAPLPTKMPNYCSLKVGDILMSLTGNVGRVCIVDRDGLLLNQRVANLAPREEHNRAYTYFLARNEKFKENLYQIARGTAQLNLSPVEMGNLQIVIPSSDVMNHFSCVATPMFESITTSLREMISLQSSRDALLPMLLSGQINC